jgi:tRNA threonylcarbamoyl adenosine modification protein (Sua5/YciO/YrdC/YwlC family)
VIVSRKRSTAHLNDHLAPQKAYTVPAELLKIDAQNPEAETLRYAAHLLEHGGVIAVPTDTVYGLAADPFNLAAVDEIFRVKGRPEVRALPILINSLEQAKMLTRGSLPDNFLRLAKAFWPGGLTLVVDASRGVPLKVTANTGRVAVRWPRSPVVEGLIDEFESPVTGTSANISGYPSCASGDEVFLQLGERLPLVLDAGEIGVALASTIVELNGDEWRVGRVGVISAAEIAAVLA